MSASAELLSDSEESDYSDDPIEVSLDPIDGEHITLTLKKQYETEESITSLYERHYMIAEQEDMSMYVLISLPSLLAHFDLSEALRAQITIPLRTLGF